MTTDDIGNPSLESRRTFFSPAVEKWFVRLSALLVAAMGGVNLLSSVTRPTSQRLMLLAQLSPLQVRHGGRLTATLAGFALVLMAGQLWRRKRVAWLLAVVVLAVSAVSHLLKGLDYEEAAIGVALMGLLLAERHLFHARSDAPSLRRGVQVLAAALAFTLIYGTAGFYLMEHAFRTRFSLVLAVEQTLTMFTEFYDPGLEPISSLGRYFADSIYMVGGATIGYALLMLVQPVLVRTPAAAEERDRARRIVSAYGRTSLARYALFEDKHYVFAAESVIAFVPLRGVALALGDPIGPPDRVGEAIRLYCEHATHQGWQPAFYQTLPDYLEHYTRYGLESLCIGSEAIVATPEFSLEGGAGKALRTQINRMQRLQHSAQVVEAPLEDRLLPDLRQISDSWLSGRQTSEMGFAVGRFDEDYLREGLIVVARDPRGGATAFLTAVAEARQPELALDLMRRRLDAEPGTMELLLVTLITWAREHGYSRVNLGLSALADRATESREVLLERGLHFFYDRLDQFYNFKGLHSFKQKFHPLWSPRYLVHPGPPSLPAVLAALIQAEAGGSILFRAAQRLASPGGPPARPAP